MCRIKDAIKLNVINENEKDFLNFEANNMGLKIFKRELPLHATALLNANLTADFKEAFKILKENDLIEENTYLNNKKK